MTSSVSAPVAAQSSDTSARPRARTAEEIRIATRDSILDSLWPVKGPAPLPGSILPERRVVAYYGNPLSSRMGVLGEYPKDEMLKMLDAEVRAWEEADPQTPVQPALWSRRARRAEMASIACG